MSGRIARAFNENVSPQFPPIRAQIIAILIKLQASQQLFRINFGELSTIIFHVFA
jgi:hypothetical protein